MQNLKISCDLLNMHFWNSKKFARKVKEKDWVHQVYTLDSLLLQVAGKWQDSLKSRLAEKREREREREKKRDLFDLDKFWGSLDKQSGKSCYSNVMFLFSFQIPNVVTCLAASQKGFSMKWRHPFWTCLISKKDGIKNVVPF
jgi:hypothetical protein